MRRELQGVAAVVAATAFLVGACSGSPARPAASPSGASTSGSVAASPTPSALARFYDQKLRWSRCHAVFQCARLEVPIDYADPGGRTIRIAVVRLPASGERIGSLVLNPGGPGGSGVDYALGGAGVVGRTVRARYDIVGFDPRGVARSAPISCVTDRQLDYLIALEGSPDDAAEEQQIAEAWKVLGAGCQSRRPLLTAHVGTRDVARDLDVLRAALGDRRLTYLGKSYGTFLGATYAEMFPRRVGRLVLDGQLDPAASAEQIAAGQAAGFQRAFRAYLADCLERSSCPLTGTVDRAQEQVDALLDRIDSTPLRGEPGRPVTQALAVTGIAAALYDEDSWTLLNRALAQALRGNGEILLALADYYTDRGPDGHYSTNAVEALYAVSCLDRPERRSLEEFRRAAAEVEASSPVFGAYVAWGSLACTSWPVRAQTTPHVIRAEGARPILVVGTTRDPATPYAWSVSTARNLESGRLLTYVGDGHTAYQRGSSCIDAAVDRYLLTGRLPAKGTRCR